MFFALLWGCHRSQTVILPPVVERPVPVVEPPAGTVLGGRYTDVTWGFSIPIPEGWSAEPGRLSDARRLRLREPITEATLDVWVLPSYLQYPDHNDCKWVFTDIGRYGDGPIFPSQHPDPTLIAQCSPSLPTAARRLVACRMYQDVSLCVEGSLPSGAVSELYDIPLSILDTMALDAAE